VVRVVVDNMLEAVVRVVADNPVDSVVAVAAAVAIADASHGYLLR